MARMRVGRYFTLMDSFKLSRLFVGTLVLGCCLFANGCGLTQSEKDAERVVARHFVTIATNDFDTVLADYGTEFFQKTTRDEWERKVSVPAIAEFSLALCP